MVTGLFAAWSQEKLGFLAPGLEAHLGTLSYKYPIPAVRGEHKVCESRMFQKRPAPLCFLEDGFLKMITGMNPLEEHCKHREVTEADF